MPGAGSSRQVSRLSGLHLVKILLTTAGLFIVAYLLTQHASHALQLLPYAILLACPLMHIFHHNHRHRRS